MSVFKAYDIRGIYGPEINEEFAEKLGRAVIHFTKAKKIVVGYDSRTSNLKLFSALVKGIIESGRDVVHIGIVTRPMLNWVAFKYDLGIMITASHNPKEYNGFKFLWKAKPLSYDNGLDQVEKLLDKKFIRNKPGKIVSKDHIDDYVKFLSSKLRKKRKHSLKIIADASNGSAGEIIKRFFEKNEIEHEILFSEPDGTFPCHNPNPLDDNALVVLKKRVLDTKADFGFIVDPDADRIRFVDDKGIIIDNSYIQSLTSKYFLKKKSYIVHDLISRKVLSETIRRNKGKEILSKVGFVNISESMRKNKSVYGCEMSGHNYFKEFNYLDSAMLMLIYVINMYSESNKKLSTMIKPLDKYVDLGELNYKLMYDKDKVLIIDKVHDYFLKNKKKLNAKIGDLDGLSVSTKDYWLNIRPSNTEPLLRLRIEGKNRKTIEKAKKQIEKFILPK